jgi:hypothetical protein
MRVCILTLCLTTRVDFGGICPASLLRVQTDGFEGKEARGGCVCSEV